MNCNKTNYEYQCRDGKECEYDQGIDYQSSNSHLAGPCGQQNCWHSCFVCKYNHQNDCEKEGAEMKTYQLWNPDPEGWCLLVDTTDIIQVVDNVEGWLSSGYEPEEIIRQCEEEAPEETLYNWLLETGRAAMPEFFYSNEDVTIIDTSGEIYNNFSDGDFFTYPAIWDKKGKLVFCDVLEDELEVELDPEGIYKIESGNVLVTVFSRWQGVNPTAKIMTAEEFFEWKEAGECS